MIHHEHEQGSEAWLAARVGVITGSRFCDARDRLSDKAGKPEKVCKKTGKILAPAVHAKRGEPSAKMLAYAYDLARERCGGKAPEKFQNAAMRIGTEQEAIARKAYECRTGNLVEEVGFFTEDGGFGISPDGFIDDDGVLEIKTIVSSDVLFTVVAGGDVSGYIDQCNGYLWLLGRKWVDLVIWVPDLDYMVIKRIERDEDAIEALEADLISFSRLVAQHEATLRAALAVNVEQAAESA